MKGFLLGGVVALLLGVATLPVVVLGGDGPDPLSCAGGVVSGDELAVILTTIRTVETGGNYQTRITCATASGAYAFIDASWRHYAGLAGVDTSRYTVSVDGATRRPGRHGRLLRQRDPR